MKLEDRKRLKKKENYCNLVENVIFYVIQDHLYQKKIVSSDELQEIQNVQPNCYGAQIRRLIAILENKPEPDLLLTFCEVLKAGGYLWIASAIENTNCSEVPDEDLVDSAESNSNIKCTMLTEQLVAETKQVLAEIKKISSRLSNVELKLEQSLHPKNHTFEEPLKLPCAVEGWDMVDASTSKRFVNKCIEEFIRKPRKSFSIIEEVACRLGLEIALSFSDISLKEDLSKCDEAMAEYVITMRQVVKRVAVQHADIFKKCLDDLNMLEMNGYRTIDLIADVLFQDDLNVNWGRIICWFTFWGQFVTHLNISEIGKREEFVKFYGEFVGFYLAKRLHLWIAGAGGWRAFVERYRETQTVLSQTLGIVRLLFNYILLRT